MRIALACPYDYSYPGGVQTHISCLARELVKIGYQVTVLAPCARSRPIDEVPSVEVIKFGRSVPWPGGGSTARISFSIWYERKLKNLLTPENFDIVHIHEPLMPFFALMCSYFSTVPTVGTFHAYNEGPGKGYIMWRPILGRVAKKLTARLAVSEPASQYASRYFPGKYTIIPNGIDVERFSVPTERPSVFRKHYTNILFVGRLSEPRKGLRYLLEAYSLLKMNERRIRLIVAGPGLPDMQSYRIMSERGIDDVVFTGKLMNYELTSFYQHADIFCAPNLGKESFGLVIGEALASGVPVIASDIPGFRSVVKNRESAILVPPKDSKAIADAITTLIDNPTLRQSLIETGKARVQTFKWNNIGLQIANFYKHVYSMAYANSSASNVNLTI